MKTIYRYQLPVKDESKLRLPVNHKLLSVAPGRDGYYVDLWAEVDFVPDDRGTPKVGRIFYIVGTGHRMPEGELDYIGTAVMPDGLVWHVYAEPVGLFGVGPFA